jgi:predicted house-cleaning noncanonical NTP pyrophosphatase (MazG superfamily)
MEKLIRDNLPEIAEKNNAPIYWRTVNDVSEHIDTLERKIQEEIREFWNAHYFYQTWLKSDISQEQK